MLASFQVKIAHFAAHADKLFSMLYTSDMLLVYRLGEFALLAEPSTEDLMLDAQAAAPSPVEIVVQVSCALLLLCCRQLVHDCTAQPQSK